MLPHITAAGLVSLLVVGAAALLLFVLARAIPRPSRAAHDRGTRRKGRVLTILAGIIVFGWIVNLTVIAYWRSQFPE
jgi:hypothetical protein